MIGAERAKTVREAKLVMQMAKNIARDHVCVGARYPGKPAEYRYVVSESCDNIQKLKKDRLDKKHGKGKGKGSAISLAHNKRELEAVRLILKNQYHGQPSGAVDNLRLSRAFARMVSLANRAKYPDPEIRFNAVIAAFKGMKLNAPNVEIPRHHVFVLLEIHLEALVD